MDYGTQLIGVDGVVEGVLERNHDDVLAGEFG